MENEQDINHTVPNSQPEPIVEPVSSVDQPMKHPSRGALWLLVAVVVLVAILLATSKMKKTDTVAIPTDGSAEMVCYYGARTTASGFKDVYAMKLAISGVKAQGELLTAPAEKDKIQGDLSGSVIQGNDERIFDGTYSNVGEGMKNLDEIVIRFSLKEAMVGFGEMKENEDGSYSYADKNALNYSLKIPAVDCAVYDEAMQTPA
jgi:hypothetical protein